MKIKENIVKTAKSSCFYTKNNTNLTVSLFLEEKLESENQTEISFHNTESGKIILESIINPINDMILHSPKTKIIIKIFVIEEDEFLFECCFNALTLCLLRSGMPMCNFYVASSEKTNWLASDPRTGKIGLMFFDTEHEDFRDVMNRMVQKAKDVFLNLEQYFLEIKY